MHRRIARKVMDLLKRTHIPNFFNLHRLSFAQCGDASTIRRTVTVTFRVICLRLLVLLKEVFVS
jgi:hypothetical protein